MNLNHDLYLASTAYQASSLTMIVGAVVGCLVGAVIAFFLYKRSK